MDYLTTKMKDDKVAQFFLANNDSKEGMARLTYVNYGNLSGNKDAVKIANDIINGDKNLMFDLEGTGNVGRADTGNNTIRMNADAVNIGADNLGKVAAYTSVMAREGFLLNENARLGTSGWTDAQMVSSGIGKELALSAFKMQDAVLSDFSKMGIRYEGEYKNFRNTIGQVAQTGDLGFFSQSGRDLKVDTSGRISLDLRQGQSFFVNATEHMKGLASGARSGDIIFGNESRIEGDGRRATAGDIHTGNYEYDNLDIRFKDKNGNVIMELGNTAHGGKTDLERLLEGAAKGGGILKKV